MLNTITICTNYIVFICLLPCFINGAFNILFHLDVQCLSTMLTVQVIGPRLTHFNIILTGDYEHIQYWRTLRSYFNHPCSINLMIREGTLWAVFVISWSRVPTCTKFSIAKQCKIVTSHELVFTVNMTSNACTSKPHCLQKQVTGPNKVNVYMNLLQ